MVMYSNMMNLLNLIDTKMPRPNQLLHKKRWDTHICLSNSHLNLKLINYLICNFDDFLKHLNLFLIANNTNFGAFQEEIS